MSKIIQKSLYGSVAILKGYCKNCKETSFIINGEYQCCLEPVVKNIEKEITKRECIGENDRSIIPKKIKDEILEQQNFKCIYCEHNLLKPRWDAKRSKYFKHRIHFDHFVSWSYSRDNHKTNLYASCPLCNHLKSNKYFYDLISAREYLNEKRKERQA